MLADAPSVVRREGGREWEDDDRACGNPGSTPRCATYPRALRRLGGSGSVTGAGSASDNVREPGARER
jgi:hypothetical protein